MVVRNAPDSVIPWSWSQQDLLNGLIMKDEEKNWVKDDSKAWENKWMVIPLAELGKWI